MSVGYVICVCSCSIFLLINAVDSDSAVQTCNGVVQTCNGVEQTCNVLRKHVMVLWSCNGAMQTCNGVM